MSLEARLDTLLAEIEGPAWFAACGAELTAAERDELCLYEAELGFVGVPLAAVVHWHDAASVARRSDWSRVWWEAESALEAQLKAASLAQYTEDALLAGLSRVTLAAAFLTGAAALALARAQVADEALMRVAAGAGAQACHQAGLARAADAGGDHAFERKFRLFAAGRWPLGIVGGRFFVF